jgi:hypothetical protein
MTNQSQYRELFLQYNHLIRLLKIVDNLEEVLATVVKTHALDTEVQRTDSHRLADIILHAALQDIAASYVPERTDDLIESFRLQQILKESRIHKTSNAPLPVEIL